METTSNGLVWVGLALGVRALSVEMAVLTWGS